ncbi:hypothetical protein HFN76_34675 [Rhizobium laguerreae]|uniref:hypothetical protein n=1 Tax=Rhizobium laguerreae TaxID=1076926 RepID=UPI001C9208DE|nr:hypothetical protein [Rhizobium laguerreae]MBY3517256.1 hypothetical protein [Rhizobium laguerreae]
MAVASDRVNRVHALRLVLVKDMRERSAFSELCNMEAKRQVAALATQHASKELAIAEDRRAATEVQLYQQLISLDTLSVTALDRAKLLIERLEIEVTLRLQRLDDARVAQEKAEAAAAETRACWVKCLVARHKWEQIESDVRRSVDTHAESAAEIEADDESMPWYGRVSRSQMSGNLI